MGKWFVADDVPSFRDQHLIETYKSLVPIATSALRAAMLLNGGAAVALLAFLGSVARDSSARHLDMRWPMGLFLVGVALAVVAHGTAYLTQLALYNDSLNRRPPSQERHTPWLWGTICVVFVSVAVFIGGAMLAVSRFAA